MFNKLPNANYTHLKILIVKILQLHVWPAGAAGWFIRNFELIFILFSWYLARLLSGNNNSISLKRKYTQQYTCNFDLFYYPFDTQVKRFHWTCIKKNLTYWFQQELFTLRCAVRYRYETLFFFALNFHFSFFSFCSFSFNCNSFLFTLGISSPSMIKRNWMRKFVMIPGKQNFWFNLNISAKGLKFKTLF